ncbi:hypothetical protein BRARA_I00228 [Brassica rapa]|uniref:PGG domain-containing protein n=1 Tax=Brassica campestris TaxID=3711 RepID=A0A397XQA1_BRACM|nr:hypothetical protein BRARA_I00228 [Brassica rapa]
MSREGMEGLNPYVLKNNDGDTALHLAMKCRSAQCILSLVHAYPQACFLANNKGVSPLFIAIQEGLTAMVKSLLENSDSDGTDLQLEGRKDLVHVALKARNTDIIDVILKKYPSLENERDEEGMTCLSFGASIGFYKGVCNLLDRSTRGVYECNDDGSFPIHIAVQKCHMGVVFAILIRCPNSKHLLNRKGQNILHIASRSGKAAFFLSVLLERTSKVQLMEKQDIDGNTPLHLATISWRPRTIYLLLFHYKGKCMNTVNNDARQSTWLMFKKKITRRTDPPAGDKNKDYVNTLLVVAALVATVTFAAGFTIPGGFNSSEPNQGLPTLAGDRKLTYFMVFDILAMQSSIVTIATLIWAQLGDPALVHTSLNVALPSLFFALLCMPAAFYFGVFVVFARVKGLVIFLDVASAVFIFLMLFLLGPHVLLRIPGIPAAFGAYFVLFVLLVDDDHHEQASPAKISSKEASAAKSSSEEASAAKISVTTKKVLTRKSVSF